MEVYIFTDDCLTGIETIDNEHRRLFAMINEGIELVNSDDKIVLNMAKKLIVQLKEYAATHFDHEEAYMKKIGDVELERQKREHKQFVEYMDSHNESGLNEENAREKVLELLNYLSRWLYRHILGSDIMIGYNVKEKQEDIFEFTDKYKTESEFIDEEHKKLFEMIKETNDFTYTVKGLKSKKKYSVKARAYGKRNGKYIWGNWSKTISKKVK